MYVEPLTNFMEQSTSTEANSSFYETESFFVVFTRADHWILSCSHLHIILFKLYSLILWLYLSDFKCFSEPHHIQ